MSIPFIDLKTQQSLIRPAVEQRFQDVLNHGAYIMGPEIMEMETELADFCGASHCLSCSSGTDALLMCLMAWGVGRGDAVFVPAFTFTASCEVITILGATPVFVDVEPHTFNICPASLTQGIHDAQSAGLHLKCVIAVDLFGRSVDWGNIVPIAHAHNMYVLDDAAQGFGGSYNGRMLGSIADATTTSFFPAKPLGCYGDGGAVFTNDDALHTIMESIRVHGQDTGDKYKNARIGLNARMDSIQAGVILEKMTIFEQEIVARNTIAERYNTLLKDSVIVPEIPDGILSTWAQYTVILPKGTNRDTIQKSMQAQGVPTAVYYPIPMHRQHAYQNGIIADGALPNCDELSHTVLSLPMHPYLSLHDQDTVVQSLVNALR